MSKINFNQGNSGDSAFGSFGQTLQVLFDESISDATVVHESWTHAWGRAVSYAWQSEENKNELLALPLKVLAKFNFNPPAGVDIIVVEANHSENKTITLYPSKGDVKYNHKNIECGYYKAYLVDIDSIKNTEKKSNNDGEQVSFKLAPIVKNDYFSSTLKSEISPVNGWIDMPVEGVIARHPSGKLWWITTEEIKLDEWPENKIFTAPMMDQFMANDASLPNFFKLGSTIVMKLPPKPDDEHTPMALMDYDALGKIYPFTT